MENFLGTLIPILIAVVGIIASAIHKKNKEEQVKQEYPELDEEPVYRTSDNYFNSGIKSIDDFFAQNFSEEESTSDQPGETYAEEEKDQIESKKQEYENFEPLTKEKGEDIVETTEEQNTAEKDYHKQPYAKKRSQSGGQESIQKILHRFSNDPRQAIILSEIINRKQY